MTALHICLSIYLSISIYTYLHYVLICCMIINEYLRIMDDTVCVTMIF